MMGTAHAAAWGDKPGIVRPGLSIVSFKLMWRNTLRGFVSVEFGSGLRLNDCQVHCHANGRIWIALPGKPLLDENGQHKRDGTGKLSYVPVAEWRDRATSDQFSEIVTALLRERYPGALDRGGTA
jgi:hypothetical protein